MKFADGFWLSRTGYTIDYAVHPCEIRTDGSAIRVSAAAQTIFHRSMTLGGVMLTVVFTAVMEDVIRVQIVHHKGACRTLPAFELHSDPAYRPVITETDDAVTLQAGKTAVTVRKGRCWDIRYTYDGKALTGSGWRAASYIRQQADRAAQRCRDAESEPFFSIPPPPDGCYLREQLSLSVGECIYGFGEKFTPFVKNGQSVTVWNADGGTCTDQSYKSVPFYLSSRGYGVFTEHTGCVSYEAASETVSRVSMTVAGESLTYDIIGGASCADVLRRYTDLTGKPALPPAESFGLWLSTSFTTDYDEATVCTFLDGMRQRQIPLQMFHFDCFWMKAGTWTSFVWDKEMFPDPQGMLRRLKAEYGIGICLWINPYIAQDSALFDEGAEKGYFLHRTDGSIFQTDLWQSGMAIVDFTNPAAAAWFADKIRQLCADGADAIRTDFGERIPARGVVWHDGSDPAAMHNYYAYLYNKTVFEALRRCKGEDHAVLYARSATAGCQQFPVHWGGDCASDYPAMAETLRGGLSLTASGFGFFSHDIGGFEQTATADVYKRWIAFGLMSTHSRLHGSSSYRVPWLYEEDDPADPENACAVLRFFTNLKGRLMPYLWAEANRTHETGIPMMRAMVLDFADDPACLTLDRQYMLGESLLCAPVMDESGTVDFYLPAGEWFDLLGSRNAPPVQGGRWIRRTCGYLEMPIYVKPDSILVLGAFQGDFRYDYLKGAEVLICGLADGHTAKAEIYRAEGGLACTLTASRCGRTVTLHCSGTHTQFTVCIAGTDICVHAGADGITTLILPETDPASGIYTDQKQHPAKGA
ncbi:MAG: alpha-xylosidase [Oscillospiraceae bacterium]|nr:alpha-xylosidase [Oscillospiraceae bacterium]